MPKNNWCIFEATTVVSPIAHSTKPTTKQKLKWYKNDWIFFSTCVSSEAIWLKCGATLLNNNARSVFILIVPTIYFLFEYLWWLAFCFNNSVNISQPECGRSTHRRIWRKHRTKYINFTLSVFNICWLIFWFQESIASWGMQASRRQINNMSSSNESDELKEKF